MPSNEDSLIKRVQFSYLQLSLVASDLNEVSDQLGKSVAELDAALKKLNLGISAWVSMRSDEYEDGTYVIDQIGYAKVEGKWGITLRTMNGHVNWPDQEQVDTWLFNDSPRSLRLSAIAHIPALLEALSKEATENTQKIKARLAEAQEVATAVKAAAEMPKESAQKSKERQSK